MRECVFNFRIAWSIFKNKFLLYEKKFFDIAARCVLYEIGFAFFKFYIESTEWTYGSTFKQEAIEHGV